MNTADELLATLRDLRTRKPDWREACDLLPRRIGVAFTPLSDETMLAVWEEVVATLRDLHARGDLHDRLTALLGEALLQARRDTLQDRIVADVEALVRDSLRPRNPWRLHKCTAAVMRLHLPADQVALRERLQLAVLPALDCTPQVFRGALVFPDEVKPIVERSGQLTGAARVAAQRLIQGFWDQSLALAEPLRIQLDADEVRRRLKGRGALVNYQPLGVWERLLDRADKPPWDLLYPHNLAPVGELDWTDDQIWGVLTSVTYLGVSDYLRTYRSEHWGRVLALWRPHVTPGSDAETLLIRFEEALGLRPGSSPTLPEALPTSLDDRLALARSLVQDGELTLHPPDPTQPVPEWLAEAAALMSGTTDPRFRGFGRIPDDERSYWKLGGVDWDEAVWLGLDASGDCYLMCPDVLGPSGRPAVLRGDHAIRLAEPFADDIGDFVVRLALPGHVARTLDSDGADRLCPKRVRVTRRG